MRDDEGWINEDKPAVAILLIFRKPLGRHGEAFCESQCLFLSDPLKDTRYTYLSAFKSIGDIDISSDIQYVNGARDHACLINRL